jgi:hypothetical protein
LHKLLLYGADSSITDANEMDCIDFIKLIEDQELKEQCLDLI